MTTLPSSRPSPATAAPEAAPPVGAASPAQAPATTLPEAIQVDPWHDPVIDRLGYDPRSAYVESFWLSILGPSATWLVRHLAWRFDVAPGGFVLDMAATSRSLGLGSANGKNSPFRRSFERCQQFGIAHRVGEVVLVRRRLPPLTGGQVRKLPRPVQAEHHAWLESALRGDERQAEDHRARSIALTLLRLGEDVRSVERQLHLWKFHPDAARDAAVWAEQREVGSPPDPVSVDGIPD